MEEKTLLFKLSDSILQTLSNKKYKRIRWTIIQEGHFNGRVHSPSSMSAMVTRNMVRYLMNIAMGITREDFMAMFEDLGRQIYEVANSEAADIINQAHARKKKDNKNKK